MKIESTHADYKSSQLDKEQKEMINNSVVQHPNYIPRTWIPATVKITAENSKIDSDKLVYNDIAYRTTISFVKDYDMSTVIMRMRDGEGNIISQIPTEVQIRISKAIKKEYNINPNTRNLNSEA